MLCCYKEDQLSHVTREDTGHAPAAFQFLIGDFGALGDRD